MIVIVMIPMSLMHKDVHSETGEQEKKRGVGGKVVTVVYKTICKSTNYQHNECNTNIFLIHKILNKLFNSEIEHHSTSEMF